MSLSKSKTHRSLRRVAMAATLGSAAWACGSGTTEPKPPKVRTPTAIAIVSGNDQSGIAGSSLSQPITVLVTDATGPVPGISVSFAVQAGGGSAFPGTRVTDANGLAATGWQLGAQAGATNQIRASIAGLVHSVTFSATGMAGPAALVSPTSGVGQFAIVGATVTDPPSVQVGDTFGNPVPGTAVTFSVVTGSGTITGETAVSDASGSARVGSWTLGPAAGINTLRATLPTGAFSDILATGTAAALQITDGIGQSGNVGTLLPVVPAVRAADGDNGPLAGVPVTFAVTAGGGTVLGSVGITDAGGIARPSGWILGPSPGANELTATAPGVPAVTFTATGLPGLPAAIVFDTPGPLAAFEGNFVTARPSLRVLDLLGNPIGGAPVVFDLLAGNGQVFGATAITDPSGRAQVQAWRLGQGSTINTLRATTPGLAPVTIDATASPVPPGDYQIDVRYIGLEPTPGQRAAFDAAIARWQLIIVGDLSNVAGPIPATGTLCDAVPESVVDDLVIFVRLEAIDGTGGTLGSAGPCRIRSSNSLTVVGGMRFDVADLVALESSGHLNAVILHEMAHVIGVGTLWLTKGLLLGPATSATPGDPHFVGPASLTVFPTLAPSTPYFGIPVPVENEGGLGTINSHWRKSVLRNELMTGSISTSTSAVPPLSALSLVSLRDLGYLVNDAVADPFELLPALQAAGGGGPVIVLPPVSRQPILTWPDRRP